MIRRGLMALASVALVSLLTWGQAAAPRLPLSIAIGGQIQDYLEPCGCGGRLAGGLANRAALLNEWRAEGPGAKVVIELGDMGEVPDRRAIIARGLARFGVDVLALGPMDLAHWADWQPILAAHAVKPISMTTPEGDEALPISQIVETGGWKVGVVSLNTLTTPDYPLFDRVVAEVGRLRAEGCQPVVVASFLRHTDTMLLLEYFPAEERPEVVAQAMDWDFEDQTSERFGITWAPVARRGRSVTSITFQPDGTQTTWSRLNEDGEGQDATIRAWVDAYYQQQRVGEVSASPTAATVAFARPEACLPCHQASVEAWREHPHAHAVETLEIIERDVAGCLGCHDETFRRASIRPPLTGDRGVQCATCHGGLEAHLDAPETNLPTGLDQAGCETCHMVEHSPNWNYQRYLASVVGACQGQVQARLAVPAPAVGPQLGPAPAR